MGRKMLNKLHSRKGASITFALLAFLVCAVISAVLLASASAAAGRASGLAEMDQRYYAVTSAAQLFCDALEAESQEMKIQRITQLDETNTSIYDAEAKSTWHNYAREEIPSLKILCGSETILEMEESSGIGLVTSVRKRSFLTDATLTYLIGKDEDYASSGLTVVEKLHNKSLIREGNAETPLNTWTITVSGPNEDCLPVSADATMYEDGRIEVDFSNTSDNGKVFTVQVTLRPDPSVETKTEIWGSWKLDPDSTDYYWVETRTSHFIRTTSISWVVSNVKKVSE